MQFNTRAHVIKIILFWFIVTRVFLLLVGLATRELFPHYPNWRLETYSENKVLDIWGEWDSGWYLDIAQNWYTTEPNYETHKKSCCGQNTFGFFPLYPALMKIVGWFFHDPFLAGIIISNGALLLNAALLYKLTEMSFGEMTGLRAAQYLFLWPTSFILSGVFTESLFLALLLSIFFFAKRQKWAVAGILGFCAALTKQIGALFVLPFIYEYLKNRSFNLKKIDRNAMYFVLFPLGAFVFMTYTYWMTGDFFYYYNIKKTWGSQFEDPLSTLYFFFRRPEYQFIGFFIVVALGLLVIFAKKIEFVYFLTGLIMVLVPLFSGSSIALGIPRFSSILFPVFIILSRLGENRKIHITLSILMSVLQVFLMIEWSVGLLII